jgi:excisionase family DNA binding protein
MAQNFQPTQAILTNVSDLTAIVANAVSTEFDKKFSTDNEKLYTINQVAKRLGKAHQTITRLVKDGFIEATASGLISERAIKHYLNASLK